MSRRVRVLLGLLVTLSLGLSLARWWMVAVPAHHWRDDPPTVNRLHYCPDGMGEQIDRFALVLRGQAGAWSDWLQWIRHSHQSSTWLVSVLAAPFVLLGTDAAWAFVLVSALASLGLVALLWSFLRREWGLPASDALLVCGVFLVHPATVRCFVRPQTDALLALSAFAAVVLGLRAARSKGKGLLWLLALAGTAACFVKIHALTLVLVPPAAAWLAGARGRRLAQVALAGTVVPLIVWWVVFAVGDLFGTIRIAWDYKEQFYKEWTLTSVLLLLLITVLPLLLPALRSHGPQRDTRRALWLLVLGFTGILVLCTLPPLVRFQYPALAALVVLAAGTPGARDDLGRPRRLLLLGVGAWFLLLSGLLVGLMAYGRHLGPTRDLRPLDQFLILVM